MDNMDTSMGTALAPKSPDTTVTETTMMTVAPKAARPGEARLAEWVETLYLDSEKAKDDQASTSNWEDWLNSYWGDLWDRDMPSFKPPIVVNELQSLLLQEVSDLTDSPPRIFVQADHRTPDRDKSREKAIQAYWKREFVDHQIMLATLDAAIFPMGFIGVTYDPAADFGRGRLITRARSPYSVFPDPDATDDDDWRYVVLRDVLDVVAIRDTWVDHGPRVMPDNKYSLKDNDSHSKTHAVTGLTGKYAGPMYAGTAGFTKVDGYVKARAAVLSCFILDGAVEEEIIERLNEQAEKTLVSVKRKKYPHGRLIQVANGIVLYDGPNPYVRRFPLVRVSLQPTIHTFWPPASILSGVLELYKSANKLDSLVVESGIRLNSGMIVAGTNSGIDPATFTNIPGQIILKQPQSEFVVTYPNPMPADMVQAGERFRGYARTVMGFTPSRTGAGQRGNVSPELTETEISQAMGLTRLRGRLLHNSVQKLVEVIFAGMARFYQDSRIFPNSRGDRWEPIQWKPVTGSPEDYIVHVDPASFQVRSKTMLQRLYFTLAKMNKITDGELLQALDIPNAEELSQELSTELKQKALAGLHDAQLKKTGGV
jgi:hypothetical protein